MITLIYISSVAWDFQYSIACHRFPFFISMIVKILGSKNVFYHFIIDKIAIKLCIWMIKIYVYYYSVQGSQITSRTFTSPPWNQESCSLYWDEIRRWIPNTSLNSIHTANPGGEEKITSVNSVDEEKLLRVNWAWSEAQGKAPVCKML